MLNGIVIKFNDNLLLYGLIIGRISFFFWDVNQNIIIKNSDITDILMFITPLFF